MMVNVHKDCHYILQRTVNYTDKTHFPALVTIRLQ